MVVACRQQMNAEKLHSEPLSDLQLQNVGFEDQIDGILFALAKHRRSFATVILNGCVSSSASIFAVWPFRFNPHSHSLASFALNFSF